LDAFTRAAPGFLPELLTSIRLVFDQNPAGTVILSDLGISRPDPAFFPDRR
jgi:hypothetical protein